MLPIFLRKTAKLRILLIFFYTCLKVIEAALTFSIQTQILSSLHQDEQIRVSSYRSYQCNILQKFALRWHMHYYLLNCQVKFLLALVNFCLLPLLVILYQFPVIKLLIHCSYSYDWMTFEIWWVIEGILLRTLANLHLGLDFSCEFQSPSLFTWNLGGRMVLINFRYFFPVWQDWWTKTEFFLYKRSTQM